MENTTFFTIEPINSSLYWQKRVYKFSQLKGMTKKERSSFYLEFFISAYLCNRSNLARKLDVAYSEVIFDNPNAPIIGKIAQLYSFYDEKDLKRVSEGFYHYYRISQFWDEYWTENYEALCKKIDKRFLTRCVLTFLTLSFPATYTSYLEKNTQSLFTLFDDKVNDLGFSSMSKLIECSLLFCQPGRKLTFPWDPRKLDNPMQMWNHSETKEYFEDFKEVLDKFIRSRSSMRQEDYSLFTKVKSGVLPLQYSWRRSSTSEALQDKQLVNQLMQEYSNTLTQTVSSVKEVTGDFPSSVESLKPLDSLDDKKPDSREKQIISLLETVFILEDLLLQKVLTFEKDKGQVEEVEAELKKMLLNVAGLDSDVSYDFLKLSSSHLEKFYVCLQEFVADQEQNKTNKQSLAGALADSNVMSAYQEEKNTQALVARLQQSQLPEPTGQQDSTYELLKELHNKQSVLLANALEQNQKLMDKLQESVSIKSTKKALSKYFKPDSLDKLFDHLRKNL